MSTDEKLSRREREVMDLIWADGEATAKGVLAGMRDAPSYSAVRGLLRVLVEKGFLKHRRDGVRNVYSPTARRKQAGRRAMKRTLNTFFSGDVSQAMVALLDVASSDLSKKEITDLKRMIARSRSEGR